jgi:hypothetical protein
VRGLSGTISKVTVTLNNWTESSASAFPGDRDFLLVGPTGATFEFLGGVGGFHGFSNLNLTLDDSAANALSSAQLVSGTFKPTNRNTGLCTNFLSPAPASANCAAPNGTATFASIFNGGNPNGSWSLYAMNIGTGDPAGTVSGGWTLTITVAAAANTSTTVSSNLNPSFTSAPNNSVTLSAHVTKVSDGSNVSESSVTFFDGVSSLGNVNVSAGFASLATSFSTEGAHQIRGVFNSDANFATSTGTLTQTVDNHTTANGSTYCNNGTITISTTGLAGPASPYPQHIYVSGTSGTISAVTMQLPNIHHNFFSNVDMLLVSPTGATFVPLASTGGSIVNGVTLTLADTAASLVPQNSLATGTFLPSDYRANIFFSSPAPGGPFNLPATQGSATFATSFTGDPTGPPWSLYVYDHAGGDSGTIGGYCLTLTLSSAATTTTSVTSSLNPAFTGDPVEFTAHVASGANPVTSGTVTFRENGTTLAGPTTLDASGNASFSTSTLSEGTHVITALYSGVPGTFNTSSASVSEEVDHATTINGTTYCNPGGITLPANGDT